MVDDETMELRIVAISDQHGYLPDIPECDLLLIGGDICPKSDHSSYFQLQWLDGSFRYWLERIPAKHVVAIFGNHDLVGMTHPEKIPKDLRWHYLECSSFELEGLTIFGSPWQLHFNDWAFNAPKEHGEMWLADRIYTHIPAGTHLILTHGPPYGGDLISHQLADFTLPYQQVPRQHVGSKALLSTMREIRPLAVVTGHIHGGYGVYNIELLPDDVSSPCLVVNASIVNEKYLLMNAPIRFVWDSEAQTLKHVSGTGWEI